MPWMRLPGEPSGVSLCIESYSAIGTFQNVAKRPVSHDQDQGG